jgi:phosphatidylserine/phosphatidylglycerophosphate/cardiolipin synthase-like enzyme
MNEIIALLEETIDDGFLSREEKNELRNIISEQHVTHMNRVKLILQAVLIAEEKADEKSYQAVLKWLKKVSQILGDFSAEPFYNNAFFTHTHNIRRKVIDTIGAAEKTLDICMFTLSDDKIADAITTIHKRGVKTRIITDDEKIMDKGSDIFKLKHRGISVKIDSIKSLMHHKFAIIDSHKIITGSYNWTRTGSEVNNENIVITDNGTIVQAFIKEFERLWPQMEKL